MAKRREFSRKVKAQIVLRATVEGVVCCEGCGLILGKKPYDIDHTVAEELVIDKSKPLIAADGKLLGKVCCHIPKTADDIRMVRKSDRQRDRNSGVVRPAGKMKSAPFPQTAKAERRDPNKGLPPLQRRKLYEERP